MALNREQILGKTKLRGELPRTKVTVPEWDGEVYVRTMTALERDRFETLLLQGKKRNFRGLLVVHTAVDEEGNPIFKEEDAELLGQGSVLPVERVFDAAVKVNSFSEADVAELEGKS